MSTYHVPIDDRELKLIQRDIINDFLKIEDSIKLDIDILIAKLSLIIKIMSSLNHQNLKDFEYIYEKMKISNAVMPPTKKDKKINKRTMCEN